MADSLHYRLMTDLQDLIVALGLEGTPGITGNVGGKVYVKPRDVSQRLQMNYPNVLLTAEGMAEEEGPDTNFLEEGVIYPVLVAICDNPTTDREQSQRDYLRWRNTIARQLRGLINRPLLVNCRELLTVTIHNDRAIAERTAEKDVIVSSFVARLNTLQVRLPNT